MAQVRGGISKYFVELIPRLRDHGIEPVIVSDWTRNVHLAESGLVPERKPLGRVPARLSWATWRLFGRPRSTPRVAREIDVMHHTFSHGAYLRLWDGPRVSTVFDMTPELFPSYFKLGNPHFAKRRYCEVSDAVISISENTAADMLRLYGQHLAAKTHVIPFGVGDQFFDSTGRVLNLPEHYLLFVGVRSGYKDFTTAFRAFVALAQRDPSLDFVVAGGGPFTRAENDMINASGLSSRIHKVTPSDATMPELYGRAQAFVFPSIYEGFGLPTLEALAAGTPAVLADASCSREVGGTAALYFEGGNVADLVAKLDEAMSASHRLSLKSRGPEQGTRFSWDMVAERTADLYRLVYQER